MAAASTLGVGVAAVYVVLGALALTVPQAGGLLPHFGSAIGAYVGAVPDPPLKTPRARRRSHPQAAQVAVIASPPPVAAVPVARITNAPVVPLRPATAVKTAAPPHRQRGEGHRRSDPGHRRHRRHHEHGRHRRHHDHGLHRRHHEHGRRDGHGHGRPGRRHDRRPTGARHHHRGQRHHRGTHAHRRRT